MNSQLNDTFKKATTRPAETGSDQDQNGSLVVAKPHTVKRIFRDEKQPRQKKKDARTAPVPNSSQQGRLESDGRHDKRLSGTPGAPVGMVSSSVTTRPLGFASRSKRL